MIFTAFKYSKRILGQLCDLLVPLCDWRQLRRALAALPNLKYSSICFQNLYKSSTWSWEPIVTLCQSWQSTAQLRTNLAKLAKARHEFKVSFLNKVYVRLVSPKKGYRRGAIGPGYLLVPLVWSGGTRRPHIGSWPPH